MNTGRSVSTKQLYSDFRVVAATNRDLKKCVEKGTFRNDLLFRLQAFTIELPELKARMEDVRELVLHFISKLCQRYGLEIKGVAADFTEALLAYDWPGNVRELYQTMEQVFTNPAFGANLFCHPSPGNFQGTAGPGRGESQKLLCQEEMRAEESCRPGLSIKEM